MHLLTSCAPVRSATFAVATANSEDLYSLDSQDYQAARRLVLEAVTKFVEHES